MENTENKDLCSECGGMCCKKSGCDYATRDFTTINKNKLAEVLSEGNTSIVAALQFKRIKEKLIVIPFLYLRVRNVNRDVVDLLSMKTTCSMLTENGCSYSYEDRPSGGINLVPSKNLTCYPLEKPQDIVKSWESYQRILERLVKRLTGKSVEEKLAEDVEELFLNILNENFEGVSPIEIEDIRGMIYLLMEVYPDRYNNAKKRCSCNNKLLVK
jgi:Fe-S-cluster containining protein